MGQGAGIESESLPDLVRKAGLCSERESLSVVTLGGGVSCDVLLVKSRRGAWIVKQALPQLRVKDEWLADRKRAYAETACLRTIRSLVSGHPAPEVLFEDREDFACVLEYAGDGNRTWKQDLMSGVVDRKVTDRVAALLSEIHSKTFVDTKVREEFGDDSNFHQLRLLPYLTTAAMRNTNVKSQLEEVVSFLAGKKLCLVHGDFSPKNILLLPDGRIWVIDCEVAHFGNPVFDLAFCTNHLILKAVHLASPPHLAEARRLWSVYWSTSRFRNLEGQGVRTLAALMLARVDGKSPVEYLDERERAVVRGVSRQLVKDREETFSDLIQRVTEQTGIIGA